MLNINKLVKDVNTFYNDKYLDRNKDSVDDCIDILNEQPELKKIIKKAIGKGIKEEELSHISDILTYTLVSLVIEFEGIEVEQSNDESLDVIDTSSESLDSVKMFLNEIGLYEVPTREEEYELFKRFASGDKEARDEIIVRNQRLVVSIAKKFVSQNYDLLSAVGDGNLGLMNARDKFDFNRGIKFSTYATWWIEQSIRREKTNTSRLVRLPVHFYERLYGILSFREKYLLKKGEYPTDEVIAAEFNITVDKVKEYLRASVDPISLNSPVNNGEGDQDTEYGDFIPDENSNTAELTAEFLALKRDIEAVLNMLSTREKIILLYRFGIESKETYSFSQISELFVGASYVSGSRDEKTERVREIYNSAEAKMAEKRDLIEKIEADLFHNSKLTFEDAKDEYIHLVARIAKTVLEGPEYIVFALFNGLPNTAPMTLEEVGKLLCVTRERIRQIESKALRKLRHPSRSNILREYTEGNVDYSIVRSLS